MCTLLIFPCLPKMSIPVPLAELAEPPTTDKERQALETLQCQYAVGNIGKLVWDRITRHPHMLPCLPCRPALPFAVTTSQCHGTLPALARFLRQVDDVAIAIFLHMNSSVSSWTATAAPFSCPGPKRMASPRTSDAFSANVPLLSRSSRSVGKLRHAAIILPAAKSLFTPLNNAMKGDPVAVSLGKNSEVRQPCQ
jgi:hypothetical protein